MPDMYIRLMKEHIKKYNLKEKDFIFFSKKSKHHPCPEQTFRDNANKYCRVISPDFHFHQLRKSNVTHLHDKGISLNEIQKYVRHKDSVTTTKHYLRMSNEKFNAILDVLNGVMKEI